MPAKTNAANRPQHAAAVQRPRVIWVVEVAEGRVITGWKSRKGTFRFGLARRARSEYAPERRGHRQCECANVELTARKHNPRESTAAGQKPKKQDTDFADETDWTVEEPCFVLCCIRPIRLIRGIRVLFLAFVAMNSLW